jgi:hypothetical protein
MDTPLLVIAGLTKPEMLALQESINQETTDIQNDIVDKQDVEKELGKHYAFLTTAIIVLSATNVVLKLVELWMKNKKKPGGKLPEMSLKLRDDTIVKIEKEGITIQYTDNTTTVVPVEKEKQHDWPEILKPIADVLKAILDLLKSFK